MLHKCLSHLCIAVIMLAVAGCSQTSKAPPTVRVLMVTSQADYPFAGLAQQFAKCLTERGRLKIDIPNEPKLDPKKISQYDVLLINPHHQDKIDLATQQAIIEHLKSGKGLVAMDGALAGYQDWPEWPKLIGGSAAKRHKANSYQLTVLDTNHEITLGLGRAFELFEEPTTIENFDNKANTLIRTTNKLAGPNEKKNPNTQPVVWTKQYNQGRIFVSTLGRNQKALTDERLISTIHNGILWAARQLTPIPHNVLTKAEKQQGYELLFNGKDLTGFSGDPRLWTVQDGRIVGSSANVKLKHNTFLIYEKPFSHFILKYEVKLINHNSGVQIRSKAFPDYVVKGYQPDIADGWWGSLYEEKTGRGILAKGWKDKGELVVIKGGWNHMTVKALGPKITISLNGLKTVEYTETDNKQPTSGIIALQLHQGPPMEVQFRNIKILPLEK